MKVTPRVRAPLAARIIGHVRVAIDMAGIHAVTVERRSDVLELAIEHASGDRRSIVHDALARQLLVRAGHATHRFDDRTRTLRLGPADTVEILLADEIAPVSVATLDIGPARITERAGAPRYRLSPFEVRYAADSGKLHTIPLGARAGASSQAARWRPSTDLHTHFAGCVRGHDLVRLAAEHGIAYPRALLEEAKIRVEATTNEVPIGDLQAVVRQRLASQLEVPPDRRITFLEMERIYRLRSPLTKAPAMFVPLCRTIATDYARMGIRYVELSLGSVVEARVLRAIHRELPKLEEETGVTIRFLAAISRHDDPEWDLDLVERIKTLAGSMYLVGVDFMGHETNSSAVFAPLIQALATWADKSRRGFVVRVHAGESPSHPENVRVALESARGHAVELRIGHGLYGVDEATLAEIVRSGAIVEFNLDSNIALNHLQSARAVPLRRYVEAGAAVVLGSDGYGIYRTSPEAAVQAALVAGLPPSSLGARLAATERTCVERARERDAALRSVPFVVPDDAPPTFFTPAVVERRRAAIAERDAALHTRLAEIGVSAVSSEEIAAVAGTRLVLSIAGAWRHSWEAMTEAQRTTVEREMADLVGGLDPADTIIVTGGTRFGVEAVVGRLAVARGFLVIGALVRETRPESIEGDVVSHVCIVGETLYDKAAGLYALVSERGGVSVFVGGGQIVSDEIQTAQNLRLRYLLMDGVGGASERHAAEQPARAFRHAPEALSALRVWRSVRADVVPHWYEGPNPTVDLVVVRRRALGERELLLVLRDLDAPAEPGRWALPGGFVASTTTRGERWVAAESELEAGVRELTEETGLVVGQEKLVPIGVYEERGRDPRDSARSWSRSAAYLVELDDGDAPIAGGDDAADARWFPLDGLPEELAFDHARIVAVAIARLEEGSCGRART